MIGMVGLVCSFWLIPTLRVSVYNLFKLSCFSLAPSLGCYQIFSVVLEVLEWNEMKSFTLKNECLKYFLFE